MALGQLNWRQGFFRFWVIGSALFVVAVAAINYGDIKAQFEASAFKKVWEQDELAVPIRCKNARGTAGTDFQLGLFDDLIPATRRETRPVNPSDYCWYAISKFRLLYPEFKNLSDKGLASKRYVDLPPPPPGFVVERSRDDELIDAEGENADPHPWLLLLRLATIAFGIPLIVLILGACLAWALSGFRVRQTKQPL